ncbi:MAG: beta-lactamase family protein [Clostridiales bacterium]|jgi:CubicO group peptidase (beta-lactamase class C family)|nr:beta-lactamase family protein [Clostridiales bacterium]
MHGIKIGSVPFTPEEAGYESEYLNRLNEFISRMIDDKIIQGASYHFMRFGKLFANNALGALDYRDEAKALLPDSIMRVASITKDFTAVAIFQLAERGYININDPVAMHLPEFDTSVHKGITVYNLLTHTSGLQPDWGAFEEPYYNDLINHIDTFEGNWIKASLTKPPFCKPNTQWAYSTMGFAYLGEIISRISGKTAEDFITENIAEPLGMTDTFFEVPEDKAGRVIVNTEWALPRTKAENEKRTAKHHEKLEYKDFHIPATGGGIYSSLNDLNIFSQMMHSGGKFNGVRIIGRKSVENLIHPHLNGQNLRNYCWGADEVHDCGLGFEVMNYKPFNQMSVGTYGHEGAGVSWSYVDPKENFIASMFLPYYNGQFNIIPIHRTKYVVWSGLL